MICITPDQVLMEAKSFLNAPFRHKGRSVLGLDCLGLIIASFRRCGIIIPFDDGFDYHPTWWKRGEERLHNHLLKNNFYEVKDPQKGDVITFRLFGNKYSSHHCGFIFSETQLIHTKGHGDIKDRKTKIETISDSYKRRVGSYFRYKGYV